MTFQHHPFEISSCSDQRRTNKRFVYQSFDRKGRAVMFPPPFQYVKKSAVSLEVCKHLDI
jgi:hypothetical protein